LQGNANFSHHFIVDGDSCFSQEEIRQAIAESTVWHHLIKQHTSNSSPINRWRWSIKPSNFTPQKLT
jgi:hypothetical protein